MEPLKNITRHIERGDGEPLLSRHLVVAEKTLELKQPIEAVFMAGEDRYFQLRHP
ncbi:hypothetical protein Scep_019056 [Stephania cephalantha]|uniref:Uncharacterized protein n=1 Tax=Stephania cephalantha TaxID=152367 RepID=A0AAP0IAC0_9MAGN